MAVNTIYKCDKCGAEQDIPSQFWTIGVYARVYNSTFNANLDVKATEKHEMQVCRKCLEMLGIHATKQTESNGVYNPPTLEDLIRDIVRDELQ